MLSYSTRQECKWPHKNGVDWMRKGRPLCALLWLYSSALLWTLGCSPPKATPTLLPKTSYPSYVNQTIPEPGQVVALKNFQRGDHLNDTYILLPSGRKKELVCVWVDPTDLVENGDHFYDGLGDRLQLAIDNELQPNESSTGIVYAPDALRIKDEQVVASWPVEEVACWAVRPNVGVHQATVSFQKTSGNTVEYSWWFEITNE